MRCKPFQRIVLTGASGRLGTVLRASLRELGETLVLSDRITPGEAPRDNEVFIPCELADHQAVGDLLEAADLVVHMGGASRECGFDTILHANLIGQFNLYDNALQHGIKRIVLASSNHVSGFYAIDQRVSPQMPTRPDSLYAVSKCYGESLARFYHDRHGIESTCLRIGSCSPQPRNLRALSSWLSHADFCALVRCAALAPQTGFAIVYGVSANASNWWGDDDAARIGYQPRDKAEAYRHEFVGTETATNSLQGGRTHEHDYRLPETWGSVPRAK